MLRSPWLSKHAVAKQFGIARSTLYLQSKQSAKDKVLLNQVLAVMKDHPHYGHRRIAWAMQRNEKLTRRIMKKYGLKPRRRRKRFRKPKDEGKPSSGIPNRVKDICPIRPSVIWVGDFTDIDFYGTRIYLATVLDRFTREVIGWTIGTHHSAQLVIDALQDAVRNRTPPLIFHSDQGSEYDSAACRGWLMAHHILPSQSKKASPWENGHQESWYGRFKEELGNIHRFTSLDELVEAIHQQIHYYNTKRIHSAIRMIPRQRFEQAQERWYTPVKNKKAHLSTGVS